MGLKEMIKRDVDILFNRKRFTAILCDMYQNNKSKVNSLMALYDAKIIDSLKNNFPADNNIRNSYIKRLESEYSMRRDVAEWATDTWIDLIDSAIISIIIDYEKTQEELEIALLENAVIKDEPKSDPLSTVDLFTKEDASDYYINVHHNRKNNSIYIPCGIGKTDNGFYIYGIPNERMCTHQSSDLFALVYNFLIRNSTISEEEVPSFLLSENDRTYINFQNCKYLIWAHTPKQLYFDIKSVTSRF